MIEPSIDLLYPSASPTSGPGPFGTVVHTGTPCEAFGSERKHFILSVKITRLTITSRRRRGPIRNGRRQPTHSGGRVGAHQTNDHALAVTLVEDTDTSHQEDHRRARSAREHAPLRGNTRIGELVGKVVRGRDGHSQKDVVRSCLVSTWPLQEIVHEGLLLAVLGVSGVRAPLQGLAEQRSP